MIKEIRNMSLSIYLAQNDFAFWIITKKIHHKHCNNVDGVVVVVCFFPAQWYKHYKNQYMIYNNK